jgi:hypothetical protein
LEVAPLSVPVEELTRLLPSESMLPEAISEALGISLFKVLDLYFGDLNEVRKDCLIWDLIDRHKDELQERSWFEENAHSEWEAEIRSFIEDSTF